MWQQRLEKRLLDWRLLSIAGLLFGLSIIALATVDSSELENIGGSLLDTGTFELSYDDGLRKRYSPACGCRGPAKQHWHGVTFMSRQLSLARIGETRSTDVAIYSPMPDVTSYSPGWFTMDAEVWIFKKDPAGVPSPQSFLSAEWKKANLGTASYHVLNHLMSLHLRSDASVDVYLAGPYPVGAYLPTSGSEITIRRPSPPTNASLSLREEYQALGAATYYRRNDISHPMLDLTGPTIVVKVEGRGVAFSDYKANWSSKVDREDMVTVVVLHVPFAARIAFTPWGFPSDSHAPQLLTERRLMSDALHMLVRERGHIDLHAMAMNLGEYAQAARHAASKNYHELNELNWATCPSDQQRSCRGFMEFDMPSLPPQTGYCYLDVCNTCGFFLLAAR